MKNVRVFYLKKIRFLEVKFSIYLNRRVFVMGGFGVDCSSCDLLAAPCRVFLHILICLLPYCCV